MSSDSLGRESQPKSNRATRRPRVLIVEDNPRLRKLMADVLELENYAVTEAADVVGMRWHLHDKAHEQYPDEPFDLIVTDVQMPGESGLVALEWLRHNGCPIPALVVTAFPELATRDLVRRLDATLLPKPFSLGEFRAAALATVCATYRTPYQS